MPEPEVVIWERLMRDWYARQRERIADFLIDKD
jgi:hypothetical protein